MPMSTSLLRRLLFTALLASAAAQPALLAAQAPAAAAACPEPAALVGQRAQPMAAVRYLADDALAGRLAGSAGERCAGDYIAAEFQRIGLVPAGVEGGWFQDVPLASAVNPHAPGGTGRNVLGRIAGGDPRLAGQIVVLGAHYDHLGRGPFGSLAPDAAGAVHNGADDNASGVGALLAAAELLAAGPAPARTILFLAFTGEEFGLLGSAHFTRAPTLPLDSIRAMINMDMVGRLGDEPLIVYGIGTAEEWPALVEDAARGTGLRVAPRADGYGPSDHTSFYARDIPVLHLFTNVHGDYHRPTDEWERIDEQGLRRIAHMAAHLAGALADTRPALTLIRGAGQPPAAAQAAGSGYGAYLGTIPDFAPVERGVRLSGVRAGSPAEQAGMQAGDIIVDLGEREVADLYALTAALRAHRPGDAVSLTLLRAGREVTVQVVLGSRASP
jgi:hypothetical protein